jgi:hypothetical protein
MEFLESYLKVLGRRSTAVTEIANAPVIMPLGHDPLMSATEECRESRLGLTDKFPSVRNDSLSADFKFTRLF